MEQPAENLQNGVSIPAPISHILQKYEADQSNLIPFLQDVQDEFGHISEDCIAYLSQDWGIPFIKIVGLITFHKQFQLQIGGLAPTQKGENVILVCSGSPCKVKKSDAVIRRVSEVLNIADGETTPDGKFSFQVADCLGTCGMSPVMMVNDKMYGDLTPSEATKIIQELQQQVLAKEIDQL